jgi:anti-sigma B factor antagonist
MSEETSVSFEQDGLVTIVRANESDALEAANVAKFGEDTLEYVRNHPGANLLVDFGNVEYLSSAALSEILVLHRKCRETDGDIRLCGMSNDVIKVFKITKLDRIVEVYDGPVSLAVQLYKRTLEEAAPSANP